MILAMCPSSRAQEAKCHFQALVVEAKLSLVAATSGLFLFIHSSRMIQQSRFIYLTAAPAVGRLLALVSSQWP